MEKILNENRVLVAMSGGVDSSVSAALLKEQGFDVIGITITPFKIDENCRKIDNERGCCSYKSTIDAAIVCQQLGIKHIVVDLTDVFKSNIVDYFVNDYMEGRTPNPCVMCNPIIKWDELLKIADAHNAKYLATGHYANIRFDEQLKRYILSKGFDELKDQTYFLWQLNQEHLSRTIFPLGKFQKTETRKTAERFNLSISQKPESQEVCFIPDNDYHRFILNHQLTHPMTSSHTMNNHYRNIEPGEIIFRGEIAGHHQGFPFYTIGQRKGIGVTYKDPLYVKKIIPEKNQIEIGTEDELYSIGLFADNINLVKYKNLSSSQLFSVKIRYKDSGSDANCRIDSDGLLYIDFIEKKRAVTPGQSVVMYEASDLIGGGIIKAFY